MARLRDAERRAELLDQVVLHLGQHGLADASLRPIAGALGVSLSSLTHHFGSKDDLIIAALRRSGRVQHEVQERWLRRRPEMSQVELLRTWWRWINASPRHLAMVRLGIEAVSSEATLDRMPRHLRGEQITVWRLDIERRLVAEGVPTAIAVAEATLTRAMFTGLVVDLLATGQRTRLTRTLEIGLARLDQLVQSYAAVAPTIAAPAHDPASRLVDRSNG